ncbi:MAG: serine/threonine-protein kinase [Myxococcota bacterium]
MEPPVQTASMLVPFGKYLLDAEIARGGMARVYLARLRGLGGFEKRLVVKQVLPELASDPRFVEMFVQEAKTLVQMSHPHIVPVYELGVVDGVYFLAMEFVDGATLSELLREGPLSPEIAAHVGVHVCNALSYAHERFELVHRDVTPRNVIIDSLGHVRLLDFGIAARAEGMHEGEVFGSHGYMSPEQARGQTVDARSDLFSLGTVLYEALAGEPAFLKAKVSQTRQALLEAESPRLRVDGVPPLLAEIVDGLLERNPEDRPAAAKDVESALRNWLSGAAPAGVAEELAARIEAAKTERDRRPSSRPPPSAGSKKTTDVQTLATSVTLQRLLEESDSGSAKTRPVGETTNPQEGTAKIPGRRPREDQPGTERIRPPKQAKVDAAEPDDIPESGSSPTSSDVPSAAQTAAPASASEFSPPSTTPPARRPWLAVLGALVIGGLATWGILRATADPPPLEVEPEPRPEVAVVERVEAEEPPEQPNPEGTMNEEATTVEAPAMTEEVAPTMVVAQTGLLTVNATPWGTVRVGGRSLGNTPIQSESVPAGSQIVRLDCPPLGRSARVPVRIAPGRHTRVVVNLNTDPPTVSVR